MSNFRMLKISGLILCLLILLGCLMPGCGRRSSGIGVSGRIVTDPDFLYPGSIVNSRDLAYLKQEYSLKLAGKHPANESALRSTIDLIDKTHSGFPQVILFRCSGSENQFFLTPVSWSEKVKETGSVSGEIVIVGGELSSICTAVAAADAGFSVVLVYAGPLGGLSSDTGANLRFFDIMPHTSHPDCQHKVFFEGLGVHTYPSIPSGTDMRLKAYLHRCYANTITLVHTGSYDSTHVAVVGNSVDSILTDEGVRVKGQYYLDMEPESRLAEKAGIPMDVNTQHLSCGMVFDVNGLRKSDIPFLKGHSRIQPEAIMRLTGVRADQVSVSPDATRSLSSLQRKLARDFFRDGLEYTYGYRGLAQGFDFYMRCIGIVRPGKSIKWLNSCRKVSGFNIAIHPDSGTFNSVSYTFKKNILQHSHSLLDAEYAPIRNVEIPMLERYLRYVTGNTLLTVRMPGQFYVRKATAFFKTSAPYTKDEFNHDPTTPFYTCYPMDLRDLQPRDPYGWHIVEHYVAQARGKNRWDCRPQSTSTSIINLYLLNKCSVTPAYFGGQRIEGNQINMGAALVQMLRDAR